MIVQSDSLIMSRANHMFSRSLNRQVSRGRDLLCETGATLLTANLYPLRWVTHKKLPIVPNPFADNTLPPPILFVHGVFHNWTAFACLAQRMAWNGWEHCHEINLLTTLHSVPKMAKLLALRIHQLCRQHGVDRIDIVAHSLGGIVSRYFVHVLNGESRIRNLVTLGTPHNGVPFNRNYPIPQFKTLVPESPLIKELNTYPPLKHTQGLSLCGGLDPFTKKNAGRWAHANYQEFSGIGHAGLLFSKAVALRIQNQLGVAPE